MPLFSHIQKQISHDAAHLRFKFLNIIYLLEMFRIDTYFYILFFDYFITVLYAVNASDRNLSETLNDVPYLV